MALASISTSCSVDVIICTKDRIELLAKAIRSIIEQDYPGRIRITVVFDNTAERDDLAFTSTARQVRVVANTRTPGLPGARNTGLLAASFPLVAFCDDDDSWRPDKLASQVAAMADTKATACVSGIEVHFGEQRRQRIPSGTEVTVSALSGSRLTGAHPSTYLFQRDHLLTRVGLVDEELPYGYGEDYDYLLRSAQHGRVTVLPRVGADVLWHPQGSYFSRRWEAMADGLEYLMAKHPEITANRRGTAWMQGQRAFALAALGNQPSAAMRTARKSLQLSLREPRAYLALAVAAKLLKPAYVVKVLNSHGRGI
ncbi:MAG: glycosyltransferase family 2 protein [Specibacter sp.]